MRRRSTFVHDRETPIDPARLQVTKKSLSFTSLPAAREERLTFAFSELPQELWQILRQCHELHIRWSSETISEAHAPFTSRISPGLHVFYTPSTALKEELLRSQQDGLLRQYDILCPLLKTVFGSSLRCQSALSSFTAPPILSERFAHTASLQYYSMLPSLDELATFIREKICSSNSTTCAKDAALLESVASFDLDFDSISHSLRLTAWWSDPAEPEGWAEDITSSSSSEAVEVGVLSLEQASDPFEISMSGFLTVVGEDDKPAATLFSFPSRHHPIPPSESSTQTFTVSFLQPTGLHPTLQLTFPSASSLQPPSTIPPDSHCSLHSYLTLPSAIFPDRYQLSSTDPLFLSSHNLLALRAISGELDLEAPDYLSTLKWGSNILLELATPPSSSSQSASSSEWNITIPLHLRYLPPSLTGHTTLTIPNPIVFWACTAEEGTKFPVNPFDRVNLGWDGLFGERTMFYQLRDRGSGSGLKGERLVQEIEVPTLRTEGGVFGALGMGLGRPTEVVELGTVVVVTMGFLWVLWVIGRGVWREGGRTEAKREESTKKKQ